MFQLPGHEDGPEVEKGKAKGRCNLHLFLQTSKRVTRSRTSSPRGFRNAPGVLDGGSTMAAVLEAALETKSFDYNYDYISPAARNAKR